MVKPILPRHELPGSTQPAQASNVDATVDEAPQPRRRGRKPGPLSRTAREAQRKLNHSIIEKARRTKINEALGALRQLVPADYGRRKDMDADKQSGDHNSEDENDEDEEDDEGDGEYGAPRRKTAVTDKKSTTGKKEEKEFKLEVLERTVAYLQDLTERCEDLQRENQQLLGVRRCSCQEGSREPIGRKRNRSESASSVVDSDTQSAQDERPSKRHEPLPPISSWLPLSPEFVRHSTDLPPPRHTTVAPALPSYLPTPPSSALFQPTRTPISPLSSTSTTKGSYIPSLSLGPTALPLPSLTTQLSPVSNKRRQSISQSPLSQTSSISSNKGQRVDASPTSPSHTREDETAASLLLTMRLLRSPSSPRHVTTTSPLITASVTSRRPSISGRLAPPSPPSPRLPRQEKLAAGSVSDMQKKNALEYIPVSRTAREIQMRGSAQVETPGSLLGLTGHRNKN
ncbi:hypothetical protein F5887DRAFT_947413 [Amanita rubescens]|nr:hypothetical protein F5887DRAFT_947413 [Amanita rubescens]